MQFLIFLSHVSYETLQQSLSTLYTTPDLCLLQCFVRGRDEKEIGVKADRTLKGSTERRSECLHPGRNAGHQVGWDSIKVLGVSSRHYSRLAQEAIHIRRQKNSLNGDRGKLVNAYDSVI